MRKCELYIVEGCRRKRGSEGGRRKERRAEIELGRKDERVDGRRERKENGGKHKEGTQCS